MDHSDHMDHSSHMDHSAHMGHAGHAAPAAAGSLTKMMDMGNDTSSGMEMDHMMKMYFHFGTSETILFYGWQIDSVGGLIGSMVGIFILALIYEGLKYFREHLFKKAVTSSRYSATCNKNNSSDVAPVQYFDQVLLPPPINMLSLGHAIQTMLHMLQFVISYSLMLIFMTYNVWLCLACTLGAGVGYFLFGWKKSVVVDVTEHCH